jgi:hypothetical protein
MPHRITRRKSPAYAAAALVIICFLVALQLQYNVSTTRLVSQKLMQQQSIFGSTTNAKRDTEDITSTNQGLAEQHQQERTIDKESSESKEKETAILITTNWIPSAPSPALLIEVINSIELMFEGLPHNMPIYILIDTLKRDRISGQERWDKEATLEKYSTNIIKEFMHRTNFRYHIISNHENMHIGGNLNKTLHLLDPRTEFLYFFQHDFKFVRKVNHTAIIKTMRDFPGVVKNIRFNKMANKPAKFPKGSDLCFNITEGRQNVNEIHLTRTEKWSDNNHFASVEYYKWMLEKMVVSVRRPIEDVMMNTRNADTCNVKVAQHLYGAPYESPYLEHLDGRLKYMVDKKSSLEEATVVGTTSNTTTLIE